MSLFSSNTFLFYKKDFDLKSGVDFTICFQLFFGLQALIISIVGFISIGGAGIVAIVFNLIISLITFICAVIGLLAVKNKRKEASFL